jgi:glycosyltransferase involved in cell wall biosynthesis
MSPASRPRLLVGTTVHHADDVRISRKLVPSLAAAFDVTYLSREPGPSATTGAAWVGLPGRRLRRWWGLWREVRRRPWDVLVLHDPETMPIGWLLRRRGAVVFDLHERLPDQVRDKPWIPRVLRGPAAAVAGWALARTDRVLHVTLAEPGYRDLVTQDAPVFANHPRGLHPEGAERSGRAVYVGDVTEARGVADLVEAAVRSGVPLDVVGPIPDDLAERLRSLAGSADVRLHGRLPHEAAMSLVASASLGVSPLRDLPNYRWSPPTKVEEYLAVGVPVVATDLPGTAAVAEGRAVVLVPSGDVDALAEALESAVADKDLRRWAEAGASSIPTWDDAAVVDWYRSLLSG